MGFTVIAMLHLELLSKFSHGKLPNDSFTFADFSALAAQD